MNQISEAHKHTHIFTFDSVILHDNLKEHLKGTFWNFDNLRQTAFEEKKWIILEYAIDNFNQRAIKTVNELRYIHLNCKSSIVSMSELLMVTHSQQYP